MDVQAFASLVGPLVALVVILWRQRRKRIVHLRRLWIVPSLLLAAVVHTFAQQPPPSLLMDAGLLLAIVVGAAVGQWRAQLKTLSFDADGRILSSNSATGLILILGLFAFRYAMRTVGAAWLPLDPTVVSDVFLLFAVGMVSASRLALYLRCRTLQTTATA